MYIFTCRKEMLCSTVLSQLLYHWITNSVTAFSNPNRQISHNFKKQELPHMCMCTQVRMHAHMHAHRQAIKYYWHITEPLFSSKVVSYTTEVVVEIRLKKLVGHFLRIGHFVGIPLKMYGKFGQSKWILVGWILKLVRKWPMANWYF